MNTIQKKYIRNWLIALGSIAAIVLFVASIALDWTIILWVYGIACVVALIAYFALCIAYFVGVMIYKWRVMGATTEEEKELYHWYWYAILDGAFNYTIGKLKCQMRATNSTDEEWHIDYLEKIKSVPRPKILK